MAEPKFARVPHFTVPLPIPAKATPVGPNTYHITQRQTQQTLHPRLGKTKVWGYDDGRLGPLYPGPDDRGPAREPPPRSATRTSSRRRTCCRLTRASFPEERRPCGRSRTCTVAWCRAPTMATLTRRSFRGEYTRGETQTVHYPNKQRAATLWYHDHAIAITRLNVYAGLAGYYLIRDKNDTGREPNPIGIPGGNYEIPIVIQDRIFTSRW